jgi:Putative peptidoglycan binding domain
LRASLRGILALLCAAIIALPIASAQDESSHAAPSSTSHSKSKKTKSGSSSHKASSTSHKTSKGKKSQKSARSRTRGQQKIDGERAREIQDALIRQHYLTGKPSGVWDTATQQAMQKYQEDNGWQSKTTPDSRALIKLGLGPDHEHLLNPESAMTTQPAAAHSSTSSSSTPVDPVSSKPQQ